MTIGTGTFLPSAKFAFPRSYIYEIVIARYGDTITQSGMTFTIHAVPPDLTTATIVFDSLFGIWSSNKRTLDYCVKEFYYQVGGVGTQNPLPFTLSYTLSPFTQRPCLRFEWSGGSPDFQRFALVPAPADYWLPRPL